jgi:hypothetical protein
MMLCLPVPRLQASVLRVQAGRFSVGGRLHADLVHIGAAATLGGRGDVAGAATVEGCISPGNGDPFDTGTLFCEGNVEFVSGSSFRCHVYAFDSIDTLVADGVVSGSTTVDLSRRSGAVPRDAAIISGWTSSDYSEFVKAGPQAGDFVLSVSAGDLILSLTNSLLGNRMAAGGGILSVQGLFRVDQFDIASPATLAGSGQVVADTHVDGTVAPGISGAADSATLTFSGSLTFGAAGRFACYAASHTVLDNLLVNGPVSGSCHVHMALHPLAVPLDQCIVDGHADSSFSGFSVEGDGECELSSTPSGDLLVSELSGDSDGDGMPDWWEDSYFGGRVAADADGHGDTDGTKNYDEYIAGTLPTDAGSVFELEAIYRVGSNTVIRWSSVPGRLYDVKWSSNAVASGFSNLETNLTATGESLSYTNSHTAGSMMYYRIGVRKPD